MSDIPQIELSDFTTFEGRCRTLYRIKDKDGNVVPFKFIQAQQVFNEIVEEEFERTKKEFGYAQCRIIAVKPRQVGWTTYSSVKSFDMQMRHEGSNGRIMAHDQDTTDLIYEIYQRLYDELPDYVILTEDDKPLHIDKDGNPLPIKVKIGDKSYSGKRLALKNDTRTVISTAGKGDAGGKGVTEKRLLMSEAANYTYYDDILTSILPSVPKKSDNVFVILESTANGVSGDGEGFYTEWTTAVDDWEKYESGEKERFFGFRPVFIPWYMIEEYELELAGGKMESLDGIQFDSPEIKKRYVEREKKMMEEGIINPLTKEKVIVTPEKVNWYRSFAIKTDCKGVYARAQRYYPTTPEDAFVASSASFFDSYELNERKKQLINNPPEEFIGELSWDENQDVVFEPLSTGSLKIWKHPEPQWENRYCIALDVGRGYDDGDYSVALVKDIITQQYVARWHGKVDQTSFAEIASMLGIYYNEAFIIPESNLDAVVEIIKPDGLRPYIGELYYESTRNTIRWGYFTSAGNRQKMLDFYKGWLSEGNYDKLPDKESVQQHIDFIRNKKPSSIKYEAAEGKHDDITIAHALAHIGEMWMLENMSEPKQYNPKSITQIIRKKTKKKARKFRQSQLAKRTG